MPIKQDAIVGAGMKMVCCIITRGVEVRGKVDGGCRGRGKDVSVSKTRQMR
jgi:hypothetical protein